MEEESGNPSLVLVEQHEALRDGLALLLERQGFEVVGRAATAARGEAVIVERRPELAVVGVDLPDERGTEMVKRLSGNGLATRFVIYTGHTDPGLPEAVFRSGARGLVAKPGGLSVLVEALRKVSGGGRYFDSSFVSRPGAGASQRTISSREAEILKMLAQGLTGEEIAERLLLSPQTIRTHIRNAMAKLNARTRTEAVVKALERQEIHTA
jgi:DNA-binding NarL/FixJ family response regulator